MKTLIMINDMQSDDWGTYLAYTGKASILATPRLNVQYLPMNNGHRRISLGFLWSTSGRGGSGMGGIKPCVQTGMFRASLKSAFM
ncbi:MAG TPA: hypothetical protein VK436_15585 [Methanocella sp.]|nr:hypothetical protein [Methanocella sp.]